MTEKERARIFALMDFDREYRSGTVAGMDEAGRGPLAGPVVAACVYLPEEPALPWVNDSKKVTEKRREALYGQILALGAVGVGVVDESVIDGINILQATKRAFRQAYEAMPQKPDTILVDAVTGLDIPARQVSIVKGDAKSYLIAAASIVAKVARDRMMGEFDGLYPQYGFAKNKGYGTREHMEALKKYGPCPIHRQSFLKHFYEQQAKG